MSDIIIVRNRPSAMEFLCVGIFLIFLTLKLTGTIDWSWLWVTAPLWIIPAAGLMLIGPFRIVMAGIGMCIYFIEGNENED